MRGPMRLTTLALLLGLAGCARSSAKSAVDAAEKAVGGIQEQAALIAPTQIKALSDTLADVKARFDRGEYQSALMGARSVSMMARDLGAQLPTQKAQLTSAFESAQKDVPPLISSVQAKVAELAKLRRLPPGIDPARFAALQTDVAGWGDQWAQAQAAFQKGELAAGMATANQIQGKARDAMALLKM